MAGTMSAVVRGLERLFTSGGVTGLTEGQLLDRFVTHNDASAFEALLLRHGPMVRGVCKRLLRDPNDVDDAFQATFLVLARKASTLRRRDLLGNWLYGVAYKIAMRARANAVRRHANETPSDEVGELAVTREILDDDAPTLHEEVHRLPEKYRVAVVLCYLEGLTHEQAADRLHWPVGTVKGRLSRARDMLKSRLTRRGVTLGSVAEALSLDAKILVPEALVASTVKAAALAAVGKTALATGIISAEAFALSEGAMHAMFVTKLKLAAATLAVAGTLTTGMGVYAYQEAGQEGKGSAATSSSSTVTTDAVTRAKETAQITDLSDPFAKSAQQMVDEQKKQFDKLLDELTELTPSNVDTILQQSSDMVATLFSIHPEPEVVPLGRRSHMDRIKRLYEKVEKSGAPLRASMQKTVAQAYREVLDSPIEAKRTTETVVTFDANGQKVGEDIGTPSARTLPPPPPTQPVKADDLEQRIAEEFYRDPRAEDIHTKIERQEKLHIAQNPNDPATNRRRQKIKELYAELHQLWITLRPEIVKRLASPRAETKPTAVVTTSPRVTESGPSQVVPSVRPDSPSSQPMVVAGDNSGGGGFAIKELSLQDMEKQNQVRVLIAELATKIGSEDKTPATQAILKKLEQPITMSFGKETPLEDVLKYIRTATQVQNETAGIAIYLDPVGLQEAEKTADSPIILDLEGVPLKTSLRLLLKQIGLAYCVKDGLLMISSPHGILDELRESESATTTLDKRIRVQGQGMGGMGGGMR